MKQCVFLLLYLINFRVLLSIRSIFVRTLKHDEIDDDYHSILTITAFVAAVIVLTISQNLQWRDRMASLPVSFILALFEFGTCAAFLYVADNSMKVVLLSTLSMLRIIGDRLMIINVEGLITQISDKFVSKIMFGVITGSGAVIHISLATLAIQKSSLRTTSCTSCE